MWFAIVLCCLASFVESAYSAMGNSSDAAVGTNVETKTDTVAMLIKQALASQTPERARELIALARQNLPAALTEIERLERGFKEADIDRIEGRICAVFYRQSVSRQDVSEQTMSGDGIDKQSDDGAGSETLREDAAALLLGSIEKYEALQGLAHRKAESLDRALSAVGLSQSSKWKNVAGYVSRANYGKAWSWYWLGITYDDIDAKNDAFEKSIELFSRFTKKGYFKNDIVADCFLGKVLCLVALGRYDKAEELISPEVIKPADADADYFRRITLLRLQIYAKQKQYFRMENAAKLYFDTLTGETPLTLRAKKDSLEIALKRLAAQVVLSSGGSSNPYRNTFIDRINSTIQFITSVGDEQAKAKAASILAKSDIPHALGFLKRASDKLNEKNYAEALDQAQQGLALAETQDIQTKRALAYIAVIAKAKLNHFKDAYVSAFEFAKQYPDFEKISVILQIACDSALSALQKGLITQEEYSSLLQRTASNARADSAVMQKLLWYKSAAMLIGQDYENLYNMLKVLDNSRADYLNCLYARAYAGWKLWGQTKAEEQKDKYAEKVFADLLAFASGFDNLTEKAEQDCELYNAAASVVCAFCRDQLLSESADYGGIVKLIKIFESSQCLSQEKASDLAGVKIQAYLLSGEFDRAIAIVRQHSKGNTMTEAAAKAFSDSAEQLYKHCKLLCAQGQSDAKQLAERLVKIYSMLLDFAGTHKGFFEPQRLLMIKLRFAESLAGAEKYDLAIEQYKSIENRLPQNLLGSCWLGIAQACASAGRYDEAAAYFNLLAKHTQKFTESWFEANYNLALCLFKAGKTDEARNFVRYFLLKYPDLQLDTWKQRFDELANEIGL